MNNKKSDQLFFLGNISVSISLTSQGGRAGHKEKWIIFEQVVENMLLLNYFWCLEIAFSKMMFTSLSWKEVNEEIALFSSENVKLNGPC